MAGFIGRLTGLWRRASAAGVHPLVVMFCVSGVVLFAHVVEEMLEGDTSASDNAILLALRVPGHLATPIGPNWMLLSALDIAALGGFTFIWLFTAAAAGFFALTRRWRTLMIFLGAIVGASVLDAVLKFSFHRVRPEVVPHLTQVDTASFPSGHAMISAATYLTLGSLLAHSQTSRGVRVYVLVLAVITTLLIGLSRLYLGVHWPSDVLAGWSAGAAWALLFWIVTARTEAAGGLRSPGQLS
jgi:undecaprenyl-diphosphatase